MENKKKILLVDDEKDFCFFVKGNLENTGEFDVLTTSSGKEGIKFARREKPDLILLDINMPEISGGEMAKILFDGANTKEIPLIFLTALITKDDLGNKTISKIGKYNYIAKPVTTKDLITNIKNVLKLKSKYNRTDEIAYNY
jgi:CheY-like chemotaxis protein